MRELSHESQREMEEAPYRPSNHEGRERERQEPDRGGGGEQSDSGSNLVEDHV